MKIRTIILSLIVLFAVPSFSYAQVGNLLRNKMGKVVNAGTKALGKEVDNKVDSAAIKEAQKIDDKAKENAAQDQAGQADEAGDNKAGNQQPKGINLGGLMGGKVTSKYNESYSFNNRIYMQMELYDKKDVSKIDYFMYFTDNEPNAGFETKMLATSDNGEQMTSTSAFVLDGMNKSFIIMTDMGTMKMGIISQVPDENAAQDQKVEAPKAAITKTGNSRVIAGYKCDEYLYKENDSKKYGKLWFTKDLKLKADRRSYSKTGLPAYYGSPELQDGTILAMESYNEKNEMEMKSETREVNFNFPHSITTAGYSFRQMNFDQAGGTRKK